MTSMCKYFAIQFLWFFYHSLEIFESLPWWEDHPHCVLIWFDFDLINFFYRGRSRMNTYSIIYALSRMIEYHDFERWYRKKCLGEKWRGKNEREIFVFNATNCLFDQVNYVKDETRFEGEGTNSMTSARFCWFFSSKFMYKM